jgi:hypothetical protein
LMISAKLFINLCSAWSKRRFAACTASELARRQLRSDASRRCHHLALNELWSRVTFFP